ncbi:MAG: hypothetical protein ACI8TX_002785 [Hyphomicrobiaceae bacterium]|jgi:hypothetical protein
MTAPRMLTTFAVLFSLLAISNLLKPLQLADNVGFVFLGQRLSGTANMLAGPLFGLYLAVYAAGIFRRRAYALPMGVAYAVYVIANLVMWMTTSPHAGEGGMAFGVAYMTIAIGVSSGAAYLLWRDRDELK